MKKLFILLALGILAVTAPAKAAPGSALLQDQYKSALNRMTREVRLAPNPEAKRAILEGFVSKLHDGLQKAEAMPSLNEADRATLASLAGKFSAYSAELNGQAGYDRVADADLDAYAGYIQQGMEQAPGGGGIYLSGGALIIIILLLIIIF